MTQTQPQNQTATERRATLAIDREQTKLVRELLTPEGAALKLKLAGAGERAGAFMIDFILIIIIAFIALFTLAYAADSFGLHGSQIALAIAMVFMFLLRNFYFVFFEVGRRAATPGKRALGLRVAARNGGRLTASAVFARNLTREVEIFLPVILLVFGGAQSGVNGWINLLALIWSGIFLFFPLFNADKLRAGDIIAGTWVIHAPKVKLLDDVSGTAKTAAGTEERSGFNFTHEQVNAYGIHELHVLEDVLRKSNTEIKAAVANRIRSKIDHTQAPGETDRAFLEAYYAALRRQLEQNLLLGKRKKDKFDKA